MSQSQEIESEDLISGVFERPALWDQASKSYRNRVAIDKAWSSLAAKLQLPDGKGEYQKKVLCFQTFECF